MCFGWRSEIKSAGHSDIRRQLRKLKVVPKLVCKHGYMGNNLVDEIPINFFTCRYVALFPETPNESRKAAAFIQSDRNRRTEPTIASTQITSRMLADYRLSGLAFAGRRFCHSYFVVHMSARLSVRTFRFAPLDKMHNGFPILGRSQLHS